MAKLRKDRFNRWDPTGRRVHKIDRSPGTRILLRSHFCPKSNLQVQKCDLSGFKMVANWLKLLQWTEMATNQILRLIESVPFLSLFSIPPTAAVQQCKKLVQRGKSHLCSECALISRMHLPLPMPAFEVHTDGSVRFIYNGTQVSLPCTFDNVSLGSEGWGGFRCYYYITTGGQKK